MPTTEQQIKDAFTAIKASDKTKKEKTAQYVNDVQAIFDSNPKSSRVAFKTIIENHLYQLSNIGVKSPNKKKSSIQNKKTQLMTEHFPNLLKELSDLSKVSADTHQDEQTPSNSKVESSQNQKQSSDQSQSKPKKDETFTLEELFKAKDGCVFFTCDTGEMLNLFKDWQGTDVEKQYLYQFITENSDLFEKKKILSPELIRQSIHTFIQEKVSGFLACQRNNKKPVFLYTFTDLLETLYKNETNIDLYRLEVLIAICLHDRSLYTALIEHPSFKYFSKHDIVDIYESEISLKKKHEDLTKKIDKSNVLRTFLKSEANLYTRLFCVAILAWVLITSTPIQVGILGVTLLLLLFNTLEQYLLFCRFDRALKRIDREYETSILGLVLNWFLTSMLIGAASFLVSTMAAHALPLEIILMSIIGMIMFIPVINHNFSKNRYIHSFDTDIAPLISDKHTKKINQLQKNLKDSASSSDSNPQNLESMEATLFSNKDIPKQPTLKEPSLFRASNKSDATTGSDSTNSPN
ncbi:MAG: hypothetical protein P8L77_03160 [Gammaproteobacteria bacterium]|nr:hypothetical protein [Gammaproteobacteria bacterium]